MSEQLPVKKTESIFDQLQSMRDRVMQRAYELFQINGDTCGDLDNWLAAEKELLWKPSMELKEKDNHFLLNMEMPGIDPKDVRIEVTPQELLVRATSELRTGSLFAAVNFPKNIDTEKVKAELKNGMLYITAAVAAEQQAKKVEIRAA